MRKFILPALAAAVHATAALAAPSPAVTATPTHTAAEPLPAATPDIRWDALGDPVLAALVARGLAANLDIEQAAARIERSRAVLASADAAFGPSGGVGLDVSSALASEAQQAGTRTQRRSDTVGVGLTVSWELDLFGRLRAQSGAATERVKASEAQARAVRLAVSAEIAHAWFAVQGAREQLALAQATAANRERTVALVQARLRHGQAAPLDEARAAADLDAVRAEVPLHQAALRTASHRLAVLLGDSPAGFQAPESAALEPRAVTLPLPEAATWLAHRPDLQAHEAELLARALDVQSARAAFYPRLSFSGMLGFVAGSAGTIGSGGTLAWLSLPALSAPLFDRPHLQARLGAARADQKEALAAYRQRVLLAVEEVENALAGHAAGLARLAALQRQARHAATAEQLARARHEAGASDLLELLDAQRTRHQAEAALSQALTAQRQSLAGVWKAIGAGA